MIPEGLSDREDLDFRSLSSEISDPSTSEIRRGEIYTIARAATDGFNSFFQDDVIDIAIIKSVGEQIELHQTHESMHLVQRTITLASKAKNLCTTYPKVSIFALTFFAGEYLGFSTPYLSMTMASLTACGYYFLQRQIDRENASLDGLVIDMSGPRIVTSSLRRDTATSSSRAPSPAARDPEEEDLERAIAASLRSTAPPSSRGPMEMEPPRDLDRRDSELSLESDTFAMPNGSIANKYETIIYLLTKHSNSSSFEEHEFHFISSLLTQGFGIKCESQEIIDQVLAIRYLESDREKFDAFVALIPGELIKQNFLEATRR
ncbi:MAG: hypothetical protein K940chlam1_00240 [Candidatus Anoxychlamydiales bacterium]|nr:hypothetical protein [Candidatus Anoxychlamydiales bacterium]NGX36830.1 hypothetical protein [Candidatus Anoxychlamydiales bacterium]